MPDIDLVAASAGTGKTYTLVRRATAALDGGLEPERLLATTFTVAAAAELVQRMRDHLLGLGRANEAERLLGARIGTVNAVFGGILREFALEAGRSPRTEVLTGAAADGLFKEATTAAITRRAKRMAELANRFSHRERRPGLDWTKLVSEIADAARQNRIDPDGLGESAQRSWKGIRELLPPPHVAGDAVLDLGLRKAVGDALGAISPADTTKKTMEVVNRLRDADAVLRRAPEELTWADWVRLSKLDPGKASASVVQPVIAAAAAHPAHPRLAADLQSFIEGLFDCAAEALAAFRDAKAAAGVVDFTDQEAEALELLDLPAVRSALSERIGRVLVDECQDTSPLQLALFLRLAEIAPSTWVGDGKQCIYGFRGAAPELMDAVLRGIAADTGHGVDTIATSRRSRPSLVAFLDCLFVPSFAAAGLTRKEVELGGSARLEAAGQPPPLAVMPLVAKNAGQEVAELAQGLRAILDRPEDWPVQLADGSALRPLRPGDIAVLCRRNERCTDIASSLEALGVRAAITRPGLLAQIEVVTSLSALRWAVDPSDRLALAELAAVAAGDEAWLEAALDEDGAALQAKVPCATRLQELRARLLHLTPGEALDAAMQAAEVHRIALAFGDPEARFANLDALRGLALDYERTCEARSEPATASGLASWLSGQEQAERPPNPDPNSVQVLTYHGSKGLEWPLVLLTDLSEPPEPRLFDRPVAEPGDAPDWRHPLSGRWIRFWPWPYHPQHLNVGLDAGARGSAAGDRAEARAQAESVRLLYVGMTRARDYLVLAPRQGKAGWLDRLQAADGTLLLKLPTLDGEELLAGGKGHQTRVLASRAAKPDQAAGQPIHGAVPPGVPAPIYVPLRLRPSAAPGTDPVAFRAIPLGDRLPMIGSPDMSALGEAVHGYMAADSRDVGDKARRELAAGCLARWGVGDALTPEQVVEAADRLWRWMDGRWPGHALEREVPVVGRVGPQRAAGRIDLLVRTERAAVLVDHKTFPGGRDRWPDRIKAIAPQLRCYADLVRQAGVPVHALFVHLPIAGVVLELDPM